MLLAFNCGVRDSFTRRARCENDLPPLGSSGGLERENGRGARHRTRETARGTSLSVDQLSSYALFRPCLVPHSKFFHRIFRHIHETLNIHKK